MPYLDRSAITLRRLTKERLAVAIYNNQDLFGGSNGTWEDILNRIAQMIEEDAKDK